MAKFTLALSCIRAHPTVVSFFCNSEILVYIFGQLFAYICLGFGQRYKYYISFKFIRMVDICCCFHSSLKVSETGQFAWILIPLPITITIFIANVNISDVNDIVLKELNLQTRTGNSAVTMCGLLSCYRSLMYTDLIHRDNLMARQHFIDS